MSIVFNLNTNFKINTIIIKRIIMKNLIYDKLMFNKIFVLSLLK